MDSDELSIVSESSCSSSSLTGLIVSSFLSGSEESVRGTESGHSDYNFFEIDTNDLPPAPARFQFTNSPGVHINNDDCDLLSYFEYFIDPMF